MGKCDPIRCFCFFFGTPEKGERENSAVVVLHGGADMANRQGLSSGALCGCCLSYRHQAPQRNVVFVGLKCMHSALCSCSDFRWVGRVDSGTYHTYLLISLPCLPGTCVIHRYQIMPTGCILLSLVLPPGKTPSLERSLSPAAFELTVCRSKPTQTTSYFTILPLNKAKLRTASSIHQYGDARDMLRYHGTKSRAAVPDTMHSVDILGLAVTMCDGATAQPKQSPHCAQQYSFLQGLLMEAK